MIQEPVGRVFVADVASLYVKVKAIGARESLLGRQLFAGRS